MIASVVALRKESVDRNGKIDTRRSIKMESLSARRAWIEITSEVSDRVPLAVALRKESVDRNCGVVSNSSAMAASLSARRAWIEIK